MARTYCGTPLVFFGYIQRKIDLCSERDRHKELIQHGKLCLAQAISNENNNRWVYVNWQGLTELLRVYGSWLVMVWVEENWRELTMGQQESTKVDERWRGLNEVHRELTWVYKNRTELAKIHENTTIHESWLGFATVQMNSHLRLNSLKCGYAPFLWGQKMVKSTFPDTRVAFISFL